MDYKGSLAKTFNSLEKCSLCKKDIEDQSKNGLCNDCFEKFEWNHKVGDVIQYQNDEWKIIDRIIDVTDGIFEQYLIEKDDIRLWKFL